jgi:rhodanese-related sulfurtransferase
MKKILYFIIPLVMIIIVAGYLKGNMVPANATDCKLSATEFVKANKNDAVIIDVRTKREYDSGHVDGAINIDIYQRDFRVQIDNLDKSKRYFVYCKTGIRSKSAVNYMVQSGFTKVCDLEGGTNYLARAGVKMVQ